MSDDGLIDGVTRAILLAEAARRRARMEARTAKLRAELYPTPQQKAVKASIATRRAMAAKGEPKGRWGESERDRALLALEGGEWMAHSDIGKRGGMTTQRAQWAMALCERKGLVERAENVDRTPRPRGKGLVEMQPKFLWRLTRAGKAVCGDIQARLGEIKGDAGFAFLQAATARRRAQKKARLAAGYLKNI